MSYESAHAFVKSKRPCIKPNSGFIEALRAWEGQWRPPAIRRNTTWFPCERNIYGAWGDQREQYMIFISSSLSLVYFGLAFVSRHCCRSGWNGLYLGILYKVWCTRVHMRMLVQERWYWKESKSHIEKFVLVIGPHIQRFTSRMRNLWSVTPWSRPYRLSNLSETKVRPPSKTTEGHWAIDD
jgi:hypothetical protein